MKSTIAVCTVLLTATGCAVNTHDLSSLRDQLNNCTDASVALSASAIPVIPFIQPPRNDACVETRGVLLRRLIVSTTPQRAKRFGRIISMSLTVQPFGGNLNGWTRLQTDHVLLRAAPTFVRLQSEARRPEIATVQIDSGRAVVTRSAYGSTNLIGTMMLDVYVNPGGVSVDETIFRIPQLWSENGNALPSNTLQPQLVVVRHPPGMDTVEAQLKLDYVLLRSNVELRCSTETRVTLIDRDAVRQPFWDIGTSSHNAGRDHWLALRNSELGAIRIVFETPAAANSFVNWIRSTRSTKIGDFMLGLFTGIPTALRPSVPVDRDINESFHPLEMTDIDRLRSGPLGEP